MTDRLVITTPSEREIAMTRRFAAPRALVWAAYTTPALLARWLGVHDTWTMVVCEIELRVGGAYRYQWRNAAGRTMGLRGVYREIVAPARIVATEAFDQSWYEGEGETAVALVEDDGHTTLTMTARYASRAVRDGVLRSPMERGVGLGFDQLAALLAEAR